MADSTEQDPQEQPAADMDAARTDDTGTIAASDLATEDAASDVETETVAATADETVADLADTAVADAADANVPDAADEIVADADDTNVSDAAAATGSDAEDASGDEPSEPAASDAQTEPVGADDQTDVVASEATGEAVDDVAVEPVTEDDLKRPIGELKAIVEAMIFASPEPLTPKALTKLLDNEPKEDVLQALDELKVDYLRPSGLQLVEVAGGFQIVTRPDLHEWVRRLFHERSTQKLSVQALETLAVIAYRQPITALEITEIRGVSASGVLNTLLERHLIKIVGRKQVVGRPFMYATTKEFLIRFGLKDLSDLPKVEDMAESLGIESSLLVEQTPPEEQLPLSEPDYTAATSAPDEEVRASDDVDPDDEEPTVH
ncbi:MAG: SMC-Scp complex subunit ScpB [Vicinamibacterales bacterium]